MPYRSRIRAGYESTPSSDIAYEFGSGVSRGIENAYLKKQLAQEKEDERKYNEIQNKVKAIQALESIGYKQNLPKDYVGTGEVPAVASDYADVVNYGGNEFIKEPNAYKKQVMDAELRNLQKKGDSPTLEELLTQAAAVQAMAPQGTTMRKGGLTIPLNPAPKTTKGAAVPASVQNQQVKAAGEAAEMEAMGKSAMESLNLALEANKNSYGGLFGKGIMGAKSAANYGTDDQKYINTATVINIMKTQVIKDLKKTFGAQLSDAEREYLDTVYGAMEGMSQKQREIAIINVMKIFNDKVEMAKAKSGARGIQSPVKSPAQPAQIDDDPMGLFQ